MSTKPALTRSLVALVVSNVLGGVGVASGIAVGALLVGSLGGTVLAGTGQALSVLGAALLAVPLANLAARRGRRRSLATGYAIAAAGALLILISAWLGWFVLLLAGLLAFGAAQATNLQSRYAAAELADPARRATVMSIVLWATTVGAVLGPNLSSLGGAIGARVALPEPAGPYLFSLTGFLLAFLVVGLMFVARQETEPLKSPEPARAAATPPGSVNAGGASGALRWASRHPVARFAVFVVAVGHAVMVGIMSMTPLHLQDHGHGLSAVGLTISLHILGMYALSPLVGALVDRFGALRNALVGLLLLAASALLILIAPGTLGPVIAALMLLGVGWSFTTISGSALLAGVDSGTVRVPLQGATDALMNYAGAGAALLSGPLIAWIGFGGLAVSAGALIIPAALVGWFARARRDAAFATGDQG